jgi:hypothetical protein
MRFRDRIYQHWRFFLFLLLSIACIFPVGVVKADNTITLDMVEIDIWPEYNQPSVLVIIHIFLSPTTPLPATLKFHLPSRVGDPFQVAMREADGELQDLQYSRGIEENLSVITIVASNPEIQIEYYDPSLSRLGSVRSFTYEWQGDYDVTSLSFEVQQPLTATHMQIMPPFGAGLQGEDGITYYDSTIGTIKQGYDFTVFLKYQKDNDLLTISALQVKPSSPITSKTPGRAPSLNKVLIWIASSLVLLLLIGGGVWYWRVFLINKHQHN